MHPELLALLLQAMLRPRPPKPTMRFNPAAPLDTSQIEDRRSEIPWPNPPVMMVPPWFTPPPPGHVPVAPSYPLGFPYFTPRRP